MRQGYEGGVVDNQVLCDLSYFADVTVVQGVTPMCKFDLRAGHVPHRGIKSSREVLIIDRGSTHTNGTSSQLHVQFSSAKTFSL